MAIREENQSDRTRVEIRKYPNRRYYDTTRSRYVTLEEILTAIRDGSEIRATDSKTGEDITAKLLTQIILEHDSPKLDIFPTALLHQLIRANEPLVRDFVDKYFCRALSAFLDSQRHFDQYLRQMLGLPATIPAANDWTRWMMGPFAQSFFPVSQREPPQAAPIVLPMLEPPEPTDLRSELDQLKEELESLRQQVKER